jgi:hypothetical protein
MAVIIDGGKSARLIYKPAKSRMPIEKLDLAKHLFGLAEVRVTVGLGERRRTGLIAQFFFSGSAVLEQFDRRRA